MTVYEYVKRDESCDIFSTVSFGNKMKPIVQSFIQLTFFNLLKKRLNSPRNFKKKKKNSARSLKRQEFSKKEDCPICNFLILVHNERVYRINIQQRMV